MAETRRDQMTEIVEIAELEQMIAKALADADALVAAVRAMSEEDRRAHLARLVPEDELFERLARDD